MATAEFLTGLVGGFASGREQRRRELQDALDRSTRKQEVDFEQSLALKRMEEDRRRDWQRTGERERDIERETGIRGEDLARRQRERGEDIERERIAGSEARREREGARRTEADRFERTFGLREAQIGAQMMAQEEARQAAFQQAQAEEDARQQELLTALALRQGPVDVARNAEEGFTPEELLARSIQGVGGRLGFQPSVVQQAGSPQAIAQALLIQQQEQDMARALMEQEAAKEGANLDRAALQLGMRAAALKAQSGEPADIYAEVEAARRALSGGGITATPQGQGASIGTIFDESVEEALAALRGGETEEQILDYIDADLAEPAVQDELFRAGLRNEDVPAFRARMAAQITARLSPVRKLSGGSFWGMF